MTSGSILPNIEILALILQNFVLALSLQHWNFSFILPNVGILPLYLKKHCNSNLILLNIGILTLSFHTLEFSFYFYNHWNSSPYPIKCYNSGTAFINIGILALILSNIVILALSLQTLELLFYPFKHWNSCLVRPNIRILPYPSKHWHSDLILSNIGILT